MTDAEGAPDEVLTAAAIRAAFTDLARELDGAATLSFHPGGLSETLTSIPTNPSAVAVSFTYDVDGRGAGEVRFDIAGAADQPVYELDYM